MLRLNVGVVLHGTGPFCGVKRQVSVLRADRMVSKITSTRSVCATAVPLS